MFRSLFGDRVFYRRVLHIALPITIQSFITNFVNLLDNIMVGQMGPLPMSGVSIVNELLFVFNLALFGLTSGAGIFTAQFHGSQNQEGIRQTHRYKILACILISGLCIGILLSANLPLLNLFLQGDGSAADAAAILDHGRQYLFIMLWGLIPFAISNAYTSTLRECRQTVVPMISGTAAVFTNLILNYILIFGKLGLPAMGVRGAALATVISRVVELCIVVSWPHTHLEKHPYMAGIYRHFVIPVPLLKQILWKGLPLFLNEILFATNITFLNQCYSTCALEVVSAINMTATIGNLMNVATLSLGYTLGILIGQMLGAGSAREAVRLEFRRLQFLAVATCVIFSILLAVVAPVYPQLYNTTDSIRQLCTHMIWVLAMIKPAQSFVLCCYYAIRSGGKSLTTFLFDSGFMWLVTAPLAFCLSRFTDISILPLYIICQLPELLKALIGSYLVRKGNWMQNLTVQKPRTAS